MYTCVYIYILYMCIYIYIYTYVCIHVCVYMIPELPCDAVHAAARSTLQRLCGDFTYYNLTNYNLSNPWISKSNPWFSLLWQYIFQKQVVLLCFFYYSEIAVGEIRVNSPYETPRDVMKTATDILDEDKEHVVVSKTSYLWCIVLRISYTRTFRTFDAMLNRHGKTVQVATSNGVTSCASTAYEKHQTA